PLDLPPSPTRRLFRSAWVLTLGAQWIAGSQFNVAGAITNGSPVRGFTNTTYSLWLSPTDNQYYLAQTVASNTQPLVGPLSGANGDRKSTRLNSSHQIN